MSFAITGLVMVAVAIATLVGIVVTLVRRGKNRKDEE
jgi:hypothetical protein